MKLYPITATGIKAFCSDIIIDPYDLETVYFMSICGYQATVKGIIANLLETYGISIEINRTAYYLTRSSLGYKVLTKKLPSGLVHAVVFPKLALPKNDEDQQHSFYILTKTEDEKLQLSFGILMRKPRFLCIRPGIDGYGICLMNRRIGLLSCGRWQAVIKAIHLGLITSICTILYQLQSRQNYPK